MSIKPKEKTLIDEIRKLVQANIDKAIENYYFADEPTKTEFQGIIPKKTSINESN